MNHARKNAFTLIEVLMATVIIGLVVLSLLAASNSFTRVNAAAVHISTAEFLIEQIKELTVTLQVVDPETTFTTFGPEEAALADYDDLDDFDNATFSPPINVSRQQLTLFPNFTQQISVENVNPSNFEQIVADHSSDFVKVTVEILQNGQLISSATWLRTRY